MLVLLLAVLAFISPVVAIVLAARFYVLHCRRRPDPARRFPVIAYVVILLLCVGVAFLFGMIGGIDFACSSPASGNLCGLFGVFITGPFAASAAVVLIGSAVLLLPADFETRDTPRAITSPLEPWYVRLWRGEYSLAQSFWFFLVLGTFAGNLVRVNPLFLFLPVAALLFQPALLGYEIAASVGVWRSGNRLIAAGGAGAGKVVAAKIAAVVLIAAQALLLLRMFAFLVRYRGAL